MANGFTDEMEAAVYQQVVGTTKHAKERERHEKGQDVSAPLPVDTIYRVGDTVTVTSGSFQGLTGTVHEIRQTNDGQPVYVVGDLPHPANPNTPYYYMGHQLTHGAVLDSISLPSISMPIPSQKATSIFDQTITQTQQQLGILEMVRQELSAVRTEMRQLRELVVQQLGTIQVQVMYHSPPEAFLPGGKLFNELNDVSAAVSPASTDNQSPDISGNGKPPAATRGRPRASRSNCSKAPRTNSRFDTEAYWNRRCWTG